MVMTKGQLLRAIDSARVKEAIDNAERRTSGEISVSVAPLFWGDVEKAAWKAFARMGVSATKERNGVLIFVVPSRRRFAVLGDSGIHAKVGQEFWANVAAHLSENFHTADFTRGLVNAIEEIGEQLAVHFPFNKASDSNELSNEIDFGEQS